MYATARVNQLQGVRAKLDTAVAFLVETARLGETQFMRRLIAFGVELDLTI